MVNIKILAIDFNILGTPIPGSASTNFFIVYSLYYGSTTVVMHFII